MTLLFGRKIESMWKNMEEQFMNAKTFNNLFKYQAQFLTKSCRLGFVSSATVTGKNLKEWMELIVRLNMIVSKKFSNLNFDLELVQEDYHGL